MRPYVWMRRALFVAAAVFLSPLPMATGAPAADVESFSADQPMHLTTVPLRGSLSGRSDNQVAFYAFNYPGDTSTATIGLQVYPDDSRVLQQAGFEVYGPGSTSLATRGGSQTGLSPNVSADVNTSVKGRYLVKVFNYNRDVPITFKVWAGGQAAPAPQTIDHFVAVVSAAPSVAGQTVPLYVRERVQAGVGTGSRSFPGGVVLFVHGSTTPSEAGFDVEFQDYSWMAYLAKAGFDVFAVDMVGYGASVRPAAMDDPCNVDPALQASLVPAPLAGPCASSYRGDISTVPSDREDLDAVVDYIRAFRQVDKVSIVAWSQGGPIAGGYAGMHPEKIQSLVILAPTYQRGAAPAAAPHPPMTITTRKSWEANWDRQVGCADQYDPAIRDMLWPPLVQTDPTGARWGSGVYRAPIKGTPNRIQTWSDLAANIQAPTLLISGDYDKQAPQENVLQLYEDLQTPQKAFVGVGCASHLVIFESRHTAVFQASAEWLLRGTLQGSTSGKFRVGD